MVTAGQQLGCTRQAAVVRKQAAILMCNIQLLAVIARLRARIVSRGPKWAEIQQVLQPIRWGSHDGPIGIMLSALCRATTKIGTRCVHQTDNTLTRQQIACMCCSRHARRGELTSYPVYQQMC